MRAAHRHRVQSGPDGNTLSIYAAVTVLAPAVSTVAALLLPGALGAVVSAIANGTDSAPGLLFLGAVLVTAVATNAIGTFATGAFVASRTAALRSEVARSVVASPRTHGSADLVTRLLVDARQPAVLLPILTSVALAGISALAGLALLATVDWILLVGVVIGLLAVILLVRGLVGDLTPLVQRYRAAQSEVGQRLLDAQAGAVTIRAAGTWRREVARVLTAQPPLRAAGDALWSAQRRFAWKTSLFVPAVLLVTIGVAGWSLSAGRIDAGGFAAAVGYALVIIGALDGVEAAAAIGSVRAGQARLAELPRPPLIAHPLRSPRRSPRIARPLEIHLDDLSVVADDGRVLLSSIDLYIPAGAFVAITGPAGSGRSTLARAIAGVTAPSRGRVLVGGQTFDEWARAGLDRPTTYGQGRPALLNETVGGAISLAVAAGPQTVREAARLAHLVDVIDALPEGFDTPIADVELSGGELQRLAIAQAVARSSPVLVLDDVTASLDPATEREVLSALLDARTHRTLIVVTNRTAVLECADIVLTLDSGSLAVDAPTWVAS